MKLEDYFSHREPLDGGLERLRARLAADEQPRKLMPRFALAGVIAMAITVSAVSPWIKHSQEQREFSRKLESAFLKAQTPPLMINGEEPVQLFVEREDVVVFVSAPQQTANSGR
ncbi:MAG: hypothetical protein V2J20_08525 [Wenzhouxiangella sp.]|jgi:hypothetical protein|nr:hypothetical protein [Wenzhouxiangella sp.]